MPKKWIKIFKRSKIKNYFTYFKNFFKKLVFQIKFVSLRSTKVRFFFYLSVWKIDY
jgi:hypothetical protein